MYQDAHDPIPVSYATASPVALVPHIAHTYGLQVTDCHLLLRGVGDTYLVATAGAKYILRVYRATHRTLAQAQEEANWLATLHGSGVPVSFPIPAADGSLVLQLSMPDGLRPATLFSWAPGTSPAVLTPNMLQAFGTTVAAMHNVAAVTPVTGHRTQLSPNTTLLHPLAQLQSFLSHDPATWQWLQDAAKQTTAQLDTFMASQMPSGYCHFDLLPKNFHFDGDTPALFDFDFLSTGWLANDLMTFRQHLALDSLMGRISKQDEQASWQTFLDAYTKVRPLHPDELSAIPWLSLGFWLYYSGFHTTHDQFYTYIQPAHLSGRMALIRKLVEAQWHAG